MLWISRFFELLSATKKLKASKAYLMSAASGMVIVMLLGVFGTFLFALMTGLLLWLTYTQMLAAGAGVLLSSLGIAAITLIILAIAAMIATRIFGRVRENVELIFQSQSPIVAPVVDRVTDVASSFLNGLRTSHGIKPQQTKR
jgi:hypothetical protein